MRVLYICDSVLPACIPAKQSVSQSVSRSNEWCSFNNLWSHHRYYLYRLDAVSRLDWCYPWRHHRSTDWPLVVRLQITYSDTHNEWCFLQSLADGAFIAVNTTRIFQAAWTVFLSHCLGQWSVDGQLTILTLLFSCLQLLLAGVAAGRGFSRIFGGIICSVSKWAGIFAYLLTARSVSRVFIPCSHI